MIPHFKLVIETGMHDWSHYAPDLTAELFVLAPRSAADGPSEGARQLSGNGDGD